MGFKSGSVDLFSNVKPYTDFHYAGDDSTYLDYMEEFPPFDFSTSDIERYEGCTDSLVYPGGASGPTISCGLDLGNAGYRTVSAALRYNVPDSIYDILIKATSVRGPSSVDWIKRNQVNIGRKNAVLICNGLKVFIWGLLTQKYPNLEEAPSSVKSAMLDIGFHAGVGSKRMEGFDVLIANSDWNSLATRIMESYSDFNGGKYHSIYKRRVDHGMRIKLEEGI